MALSSVNIRIDEEIKKQAETLFDELGLNMTTAINVFIRQAVRERRIPFEMTANVPSKAHPVFGSGKGKVWIADDFDEPLDEMRDYME